MLNEGDIKDDTGRGGCVQSTREGGAGCRGGAATGEVHTDLGQGLKEQVFNG